MSVLIHEHGLNVRQRQHAPESGHEGALRSGLPRSHSARMGECDNEHHLIAAFAKLSRFYEIRAIGKQTEIAHGLTDVSHEWFRVFHEC